MECFIPIKKREELLKVKKADIRPVEGKWFNVNPQEIDKNLFKSSRSDFKQEKTRQLILEALAQAEEEPIYNQPFKTYMTFENWSLKSIIKFRNSTSKYEKEYLADWVEQALEWAQRINNGDTWENLCNSPDQAYWSRTIIWKNGYLRLIGGSFQEKNSCPATDVGFKDLTSKYELYALVPLIATRQ